MVIRPLRLALRVVLALPVMIALALLAGCGPRAGVRVEGAWVRAANAGENTAAYFTLVDDEQRPLALVSAGADCAREGQLHETVRTGGVFAMHRADSLAVPAGGRLVLEPGGAHVMLLRLSRALEPGAHAALVVRLADGRTLTAAAEVRP